MSQSAMAVNQDISLDQENLTPENTVDVIRSRMYYLLSLAFSFPDKKLQSTQAELWELAATLYPNMDINKQEVDITSGGMEAEYINVFDGHEQKKYCRPYEGLWKDADRAKRQWEVKKFYQFFGLGLNKVINEMPDHIMYELEFMHYLNYRMIEADDRVSADSKTPETNRPENYLQAQKDFLERHLSSWAGNFCQLLQEKTDVPFYDQLARVAAKFIADDIEWVQERLEETNGTSS